MAKTEAQKRANAKYHAKTYKTFTVNAKIADYEEITAFSDSLGMSKAGFLLAAAKYCINNNVNLTALDKQDKP